jgi:hypothetical protein
MRAAMHMSEQAGDAKLRNDVAELRAAVGLEDKESSNHNTSQ